MIVLGSAIFAVDAVQKVRERAAATTTETTRQPVADRVLAEATTEVRATSRPHPIADTARPGREADSARPETTRRRTAVEPL